MRYKGLLNQLQANWESQYFGNEILDEWYLLHYLSQFIYLVNSSYTHNEEDDKLRFECSIPGFRFAGKPIPTESGSIRLALDPAIPALEFIDSGGGIISSLQVHEQTYPVIRSWVQENLESLGLDPSLLIDRIPYSIRIPGPGSIGHLSQPDQSNLQRISSLYRNAYTFLLQLSAVLKNTDGPCCRSDTLELHLEHIIRRNKRGKVVRSVDIGLGLPGAGFGEAHYFVRMYSSDPLSPQSMPDLPFGYWKLKGGPEAILPLSAVNTKENPGDQYQVIRDFFGYAMDASWSVLMKEF